MSRLLIKMEETNAGLMENQKEVVDSLLYKQSEILDSRLGLGLKQPEPQQQVTPAHLKRPNWNKVRFDYEQRKKQEYWAARVAQVEAADKAATDKKAE